MTVKLVEILKYKNVVKFPVMLLLFYCHITYDMMLQTEKILPAFTITHRIPN